MEMLKQSISPKWENFNVDMANKDLFGDKNSSSLNFPSDIFNTTHDMLEVYSSLMQISENATSIEKVASNCLYIYSSLQKMKERSVSVNSLALVIERSLISKSIAFESTKELLQFCSDSMVIKSQSELDRLDTQLRQIAGPWGVSEIKDTNEIKEKFSSLSNTMTSVSTKEEYLRAAHAAFGELKTVVIPMQWLSTSNSSLPPSIYSHLGTLEEVSEKSEYQDGKDMQRDSIEINGVLYKGSLGYHTIVNAIVEHLIEVASASGQKLVFLNDDLQQKALRSLAKLIIQASNRTQSGGSSYEALERFMRNENLIILKPDSIQASPLKATIDVGPYVYLPSSQNYSSSCPSWGWGFRTLIEAPTAYEIFEMDPQDESSACWGRVNVKYRNRIALSFGTCPDSQFGGDRAAKYEQGEIVLEVLIED